MRGLPRVIWVLGVASLLNDVSSEAIFPLLPVFLTSLGAPMRYIGLIEGSADALASILKVVAGRLSDRGPRQLFVAGGYTIPGARARGHRGGARALARAGGASPRPHRQGHSLGPARRDDRRIRAAVAARARLRPQPLDGSLRRGAGAAARERAAARGRQPAHGVPDRGGDRDDGADRPVLPPARAAGRRGRSQRADRRARSGDRCGAATRPTWSCACCSRWATRRMRSC